MIEEKKKQKKNPIWIILFLLASFVIFEEVIVSAGIVEVATNLWLNSSINMTNQIFLNDSYINFMNISDTLFINGSSKEVTVAGTLTATSLVGDGSGITGVPVYNITYALWSYNQSLATYAMWNEAWSSTYNETYAGQTDTNASSICGAGSYLDGSGSCINLNTT
ncbi:unnamed protein product, partial [marine sediment metagenome]